MTDEPTDDLRVSPTLTIPSRELAWRFSRSGGAGGQHVNTTDSRVELSWDLTATGALSATQRSRALRALRGDLVDGVVTVTASDRRSQVRNREIARERLADLIREAIAPPPPPRRATKPSRAAKQRRVDEKKRRGQTKELRRRPLD
jgi:ribosome-associated protein